MAAGRRYTLSEANALVGPLSEIIGEASQAREVLVDHELVATLAERAPGNGGGDEARTFTESALRFSRALAQLDRWDVIVRDLDTGLCDFPAEREGRLVYLCWKSGESRIDFWHEVDDGAQGRQPVDELTP